MDIYMKEVYFASNCETCKHRDINEENDPCCKCLEIGAREGSHVPEYWEDGSR